MCLLLWKLEIGDVKYVLKWWLFYVYLMKYFSLRLTLLQNLMKLFKAVKSWF